MPDSKELTGIKEHLNKTGVFLEQKVFLALSSDPRFSFSRREHPYSLTTNVSEVSATIRILDGTIDVFAVADVSKRGEISTDTLLCLCIECKRSDPEQKNWVFDLRTRGDEIYRFVYYDVRQNALDCEKDIFFKSLGYDGMKFFDKAIHTFQLSEREGRLSRTQSEMAYHSLKQANQAVEAISSEPEKVFRLLGTDPANILFLPVVVTTANLRMISDDEPQDVSWETGKIEPDKLKLKDKDWVHYEFPLPASLKVSGRGGLELDKRPSFVVKADKFANFIEGLLKDLPDCILDWGQ